MSASFTPQLGLGEYAAHLDTSKIATYPITVAIPASVEEELEHRVLVVQLPEGVQNDRSSERSLWCQITAYLYARVRPMPCMP